MLTLQEQAVQKIGNLSEDDLRFLLDMMERLMRPNIAENKKAVIPDRIGIAKGQDLYDDDYDIDEMNPEIAKMFGVVE